jgi:hypothetical protein
MGDLESGGTGVGGSIYANNLKQFNDGLNNTTLAVNQFAAAYRDAKRIALDDRATAQEKADAAKEALLTEISGFGSGIEGFANSYTNGVNHLNEVRHGFIRRNFMARNTKALSQKLEDLKSAFAQRGGAINPREVAANKLVKGIQPLGGQEELSAAKSKVSDAVGEGDKVGSTAAERLANLASSAAGDEGEEVAVNTAREIRRAARRARLGARVDDLAKAFGAKRTSDGRWDTTGLKPVRQKLIRNAQNIADNIKSEAASLGQPNAEQVAQNIANPSGPTGGGPPVQEGAPTEAEPRAPIEEGAPREAAPSAPAEEGAPREGEQQQQPQQGQGPPREAEEEEPESRAPRVPAEEGELGELGEEGGELGELGELGQLGGELEGGGELGGLGGALGGVLGDIGKLGPEGGISEILDAAENAGKESSNIGSKAETTGAKTNKVMQSLDEALPEVDAAEATTAEIPYVGEAVGVIGGLIQLGTAIAGAFGAGTAPAPPPPETSEDVNFAPGQVGGDFSVSRSTA